MRKMDAKILLPVLFIECGRLEFPPISPTSHFHPQQDLYSDRKVGARNCHLNVCRLRTEG